MDFLTVIIILLLGLLIGSFLNVVICRLDDIKSIITTRSHCPKCKKKLAWYDLIPLISFILLAQKCRYCGRQISWQYPLVELATAILFLVIYLNFGLSLYTYYLLLTTCFLIVIFVYDLYHQLIADEMIWSALVIWILFIIISYLYPSTSYKLQATSSLYGALVGALVILTLVLVTRGKGMGIGDIKLVFLLGLLTGWPKILIALFFAFTIGSIIGLLLIAYRKKTLKSVIAFGPFLIIGFYITLFWGEKILNWYLR